jgi:hypothetical protein
MKIFNTILLVFLSLLLTNVAIAKKRVALVIGNSQYGIELGNLNSPVNDANDISKKLRDFGFQVTTLKNATQREMDDAISLFGQKLTENRSIGLFYFAGHGVQIGGENYLIPVGSGITSEADIKYKAVNLGQILNQMEQANNGLNLVILDASRNNSVIRSLRSAGRGLARVNAPSGSLLLYATKPGQIAPDSVGRNGIFTEQLLQSMNDNLKVEDIFKSVAINVSKKTNKKQEPWMEGVLYGNFYFNPSINVDTPRQNSIINKSAEDSFIESMDKDNPNQIAAYLKKYPHGKLSALFRAKLDKYFYNEYALKREKVYWQQLDKIDLIEINEYLNNYPDGTFAVKARELQKNINQSQIYNLAISSDISSSNIFVNGRFYSLSKLSIPLPKGKYKIFISKQGYTPFIQTVELNKNTTIKGKLEPEKQIKKHVKRTSGVLINEFTPIYKNESLSNPVVTYLSKKNFGKTFKVLDMGKNISAIKISIEGIKGWIPRQHALLPEEGKSFIKALENSDSARSKKVSILTKKNIKQSPVGVPFYNNPLLIGKKTNDLVVCGIFYVFSETAHAVLMGVSDRINLRKSFELYWVDKQDIVEWNSREGIGFDKAKSKKRERAILFSNKELDDAVIGVEEKTHKNFMFYQYRYPVLNIGGAGEDVTYKVLYMAGENKADIETCMVGYIPKYNDSSESQIKESILMSKSELERVWLFISSISEAINSNKIEHERVITSFRAFKMHNSVRITSNINELVKQAIGVKLNKKIFDESIDSFVSILNTENRQRKKLLKYLRKKNVYIEEVVNEKELIVEEWDDDFGEYITTIGENRLYFFSTDSPHLSEKNLITSPKKYTWLPKTFLP